MVTETLQFFNSELNAKVVTLQDAKQLPRQPGVYRIFNNTGDLLYVGKAKDLRARVRYYFKKEYENIRTLQLVSQRAKIIVTLTQSEAQALWLEQNYIHYARPRYNVLLLDDKSYPWICLTFGRYPQLKLHRGERNKKEGKFFGPFHSSHSARLLLKLLKHIFYIRHCKGGFRAHKSRPCLDHQLGYCSGPCFPSMQVDEAAYQKEVRELEEFLKGKTLKVVDKLAKKMHGSSEKHDYNRALFYREQIRAVQQLTDRQAVQTTRHDDMDVLAIAGQQEWACVYKFIVRKSAVVSGHAHFLKASEDFTEEELMEQFMIQFYSLDHKHGNDLFGDAVHERCWPESILTQDFFRKGELIKDALSLNGGPKIRFELVGRCTEKRRLLEMAELNAKQALSTHLSHWQRRLDLFASLKKEWNIPDLKAIDCIDISHLQGSSIVGAVVRLTPKGLDFGSFRKYILKELNHSDDCAAIALTIRKYYRSVLPEKLPQILLIDGGKAQFIAAQNALSELQLKDALLSPVLLAIAKGKERRSGWEKVWCKKGEIPFDRKRLWALLEVRDASHRYAVSQHRKLRSKNFFADSIKNLEGIGPIKYAKLLNHVGGLGQLKGSSLQKIEAIPGFSKILARRIWYALHPESLVDEQH